MWSHGGDMFELENRDQPQNYTDFSANINPLGQPESVRKAIENSGKKSLNYPDPFQRELKKAIAEFEGVSKEQIVCGNGAAEIIFKIVQHFAPEKAMVLAPTFSEYENALNQFRAEVQHYHLERKKSFLLDEKILNQPKGLDMIFLCNPNNPTGSLINLDLMTKILEKSKENGMIVVVDECFMDFTLENDQSLKSQLKNFENLIIIKAFTKSFAIPGIRLGYCLVNNSQIAEKLSNTGPPWSVSTPAQLAGIAATKEGEFLLKTKEIVEIERKFLTKALKNLGFRVYPSEVNYIFFESVITDLRDKLIKKGIVIRDCSNYIGLRKGDYRIAVKTREENLKLIKGIEALLCQE